MCKNFPKPTHTLRVMRQFETSLQFIVVPNYMQGSVVAASKLCKDSENLV